MTKTTNEMLFNTLKTKVNATPKYKAELEAMGYTLTNDDFDTYWTVNGVAISKGEGAAYFFFAGRCVETLKELAKVDWEHYFKVRDERIAKRTAPTPTIYNAIAKWDKNGYEGHNRTIEKFKDLYYTVHSDKVSWREREIERARAAVESALRELEWQTRKLAEAEHEVEAAKTERARMLSRA